MKSIGLTCKLSSERTTLLHVHALQGLRAKDRASQGFKSLKAAIWKRTVVRMLSFTEANTLLPM